jgi:hypothetical protein
MDELELLEQFRDRVPEPDDETVRVARHRLMQRIDGSPDPRRPTIPAGRRQWMIPLGIAVTFVVVLALPAALPLGVPGPDPAAATALLRFARIARDAPVEPAPAPGQFLYTQTEQFTTYLFTPGEPYEPFWWSEAATERQWLGTDGSGRSLYRVGQPTFLSARDRAAYEAYVGTGGAEAQSWEFDWGRTFDERSEPGELGYEDLSDLPTDPDAVLEAMKDRGLLDAEADAWRIFAGAEDLLAVYYAAPEVRAAMYELMAQQPGIELLGKMRDELGRVGIGIGLVHDGLREELVFHRRTAQLLSERSVVVEPIDVSDILSNPGPTQVAAASEPGQVMWSTVYLHYGKVVDSMSETPRA